MKTVEALLHMVCASVGSVSSPGLPCRTWISPSCFLIFTLTTALFHDAVPISPRSRKCEVTMSYASKNLAKSGTAMPI